MWRDLGLTKRDWDRTPQAVRTLLLALQQQVCLMGMRFTAYEKQLVALREQVAQVDDLKAEINELRERLGQNSSNSSKPPSSDPPSSKAKPSREPKGRQRGGQPGHQGCARQLKPETEVDHLIDFRARELQAVWTTLTRHRCRPGAPSGVGSASRASDRD